VAILQRYLAQVPALRAAGAEIVILPEHLLAMRETDPDRNAPELTRLLETAAAENHVAIVIGVDRRDAAGIEWNEARLYRPGTTPITYDKQHMLPGYESRYRPGNSVTVFAHENSRVGLAICKDLDFPSLGRAYGAERIAALIVPAFDFTADGWLHGRMALVRGVESGFAVVRVAKRGRLTVSNHRGEVLADERSDAAEFATVVAKCPLRTVSTLYARWGNWCGWLAVGVTLLATVRDLATRRRGRVQMADAR
jgi:apolipoprotein N-acyltransferase